MAQIIPLNRLAEILATRVGVSEAEAQHFIQLYFETISYGLVSGGAVSIKGLGTFARSSDADSVVTFTPDDSLAKILNAPFEAFVPITIPGNVDISDEKVEDIDSQESLDKDDLSQTGHSSDIEKRSAENEFQESQKSQEPTTDVSIADPEAGEDRTSDVDNHIIESPVTSQKQSEIDQDDNFNEQPEPVSENTDDPTVNSDADTEATAKDTDSLDTDTATDVVADGFDEDDDEHAEVYILPSRKCRSMLWGIIGLMVGALIGIAIGYYFYDDIDRYFGERPVAVISKSGTIKPKPRTIARAKDTRKDSCASDTSKVVHKEATPEPRYDVVTSHRFLTTLAKEYYGVKDYWVYIYEANKTRLRHPDRIKPGTRILIPEITEFLADPTPTQTNIRQARQLATQIYGRFK